jgi:hypothetical protein
MRFSISRNFTRLYYCLLRPALLLTCLARRSEVAQSRACGVPCSCGSASADSTAPWTSVRTERARQCYQRSVSYVASPAYNARRCRRATSPEAARAALQCRTRMAAVPQRQQALEAGFRQESDPSYACAGRPPADFAALAARVCSGG